MSEEVGVWVSGEAGGWVKSGVGICEKEKAEAKAKAQAR